ncbi:MAG: YdeI/OmpD-associated family protein [Actinobacteria bacterium]|nr:YdeI/OmpD-associated family protein [Actinomycetota bacterium]MCA1719612.1 YdeI/OmpD-associated family protein [Actinomycetota bacterium]
MATPEFFASPADWRAWLEQHAAVESELLVGFWKKGTGRACMTWSESVDEALCFGWIDAVRRRIDDESYSIRFTRRKTSSTWSAVNVAKVAGLEAAGRMTDAGRAAFAARREDRTSTYAYEQGEVVLDDAPLRSDPAAWAFWSAQPPSYRKVCAHWVTSAKRPETRAKRLAELVQDCAAGRKIRTQRWA